MAYLDKILTSYLEKGILTPEEVRKDREKNGTASSAKKKVRANTAQDYEQRDYTGVQEQMMEAQRRRMEEHMQRNGGDRHA